MSQSAAAMRTTATAHEGAPDHRMSEPIRILHFADVHLGTENYGPADPDSGVSGRVSDTLRRLDEMIDYARDGDVDLAVFAGDAFHSRSPNPTYQREFAGRMLALSRLAPTVMLLGHLDSPPNTSRASTLEIYETLRVPNIWVAQAYEARLLSTKRGDVVVGAAPFLSRRRLLADVTTRGMSREEQAAVAEQLVAERLNALAAQADELAPGDAPRLLCGHFSVEGASGSQQDAMLGQQVALEWLTDPRWDYVALGHVHRHQTLSAGAPPVVYSGGLERIGFAEADEAKGFCWLELARGAGRLALRRAAGAAHAGAERRLPRRAKPHRGRPGRAEAPRPGRRRAAPGCPLDAGDRSLAQGQRYPGRVAARRHLSYCRHQQSCGAANCACGWG